MRIFLSVSACLLLLVQAATAQDCTTGFRILGWPHDDAPRTTPELRDFEGGPVVLTQKDVAKADAEFGYQDQPVVFLRLTGEGSDKLYEYTYEHVRLPIALVYGTTLLTAPTIMEPIAGGHGQISGLASIEEARELADNINSGTCPPKAGS